MFLWWVIVSSFKCKYLFRNRHICPHCYPRAFLPSYEWAQSQSLARLVVRLTASVPPLWPINSVADGSLVFYLCSVFNCFSLSFFFSFLITLLSPPVLLLSHRVFQLCFTVGYSTDVCVKWSHPSSACLGSKLLLCVCVFSVCCFVSMLGK